MRLLSTELSKRPEISPLLASREISCLCRMKMDKKKLANKIRVVSNRKKTASCPEKRLRFYTKYASLVSATLRKPLFQKFLNWIIMRENIEKKAVKDIQVRVFPFQKENGNSLAGRCNHEEGVILLFPKRRNYLQKKMGDYENKKVRFYLKSRARAALIHELLHLKYESNEREVRQLTRKYFGILVRHQNIPTQKINGLQNMLFTF